MAFTERYVTATAGGGGDGSSGTPWTLAEAFAAAAAGDRVNVLTGSYSSGAVTLTNNGTVFLPIIYRAYASTIGDLDNQRRNSDGTLDTTNFPTLTITGVIVPGTQTFFQNFIMTGALSSTLIGNTAVDGWGLISCTVTNTQNNASARAVQGDDRIRAINCDFACTGAAHANVFDSDAAAFIWACRFKTVSTSACLSVNYGTVAQSLFWGNSSSVGIDWLDNTSTNNQMNALYNTFNGIGTALRYPNALLAEINYFNFCNMVTDDTKWMDSLYAGTSDVAAFEIANRTRDVTTLLTGILPIGFGAVTTDTGGASTDYVDAAAGNFFLISTSPGIGIGLPYYADAGAYSPQRTSGGGLAANPLRGFIR